MSQCKIVIVGEHFGQKDLLKGRVFTDGAGYVLDGMLRNAGIRRKSCVVTCVINHTLDGGIDRAILGTKAEGITGTKPLKPARYVRKEYATEVERMWEEIERAKPNLIIALGNLALWATTGEVGIKKFRGTPVPAIRGGYKVLPTWAPISVIRQWTIRPIVIADLTKAKKQAEFSDIRRPKRIIYLEPSIADIEWFYEEFIIHSPELSVDIETKCNTITEIGFATSENRCLVVPFYSRISKDNNYWPDLNTERQAWDWVRRILFEYPSFGQNFMYDMKYLWRSVGITCPKFCDDTMILHHTLQPEMEKSLGFLGSIYTDEPSWKFMRNDHSTLKKED